jgi:hypothetical protein
MIYFIKDKVTGQFYFPKSIDEMVNLFDRLKTKKSTISNRFAELKKTNSPAFINDWGFHIFRNTNKKTKK